MKTKTKILTVLWIIWTLSAFTFINSWTFQSWNTIRIAQNTYAKWVINLKNADKNINNAKQDAFQARIDMYISHLCAKETRKWNRINCDELEYKTGEWKLKYITKEQASLNWRLNSNGASQAYMYLHWDSYYERAKDIFKKMRRDENEVDQYYIAWYKTKIKPEVLICIAKADSNLWNSLASKNNPGNVWNNDRWDRVPYETLEEWIEAIWNVLNNKYLGQKQTIWELSPWWLWTAPFYATSPENWNVNVINCLSMIYDKPIYEDFKFRNL